MYLTLSGRFPFEQINSFTCRYSGQLWTQSEVNDHLWFSLRSCQWDLDLRDSSFCVFRTFLSLPYILLYGIFRLWLWIGLSRSMWSGKHDSRKKISIGSSPNCQARLLEKKELMNWIESLLSPRRRPIKGKKLIAAAHWLKSQLGHSMVTCFQIKWTRRCSKRTNLQRCISVYPFQIVIVPFIINFLSNVRKYDKMDQNLAEHEVK